LLFSFMIYENESREARLCVFQDELHQLFTAARVL